ncbi:MAG TPA: hypothetical protein VN878_08970 [Usitatibacter sp.]|nr:hypothetical protein [Usitatibacter sp.]
MRTSGYFGLRPNWRRGLLAVARGVREGHVRRGEARHRTVAAPGPGERGVRQPIPLRCAA